MLGHMIEPLRHKEFPHRNHDSNRKNASSRREQLLRAIAAHDALGRRGIWSIILFLGISILALQLRDLNLFAGLSESTREALGAAPPTVLIHMILTVSTLSSIVVTIGKIQREEAASNSWAGVFGSLAFRSVFYLFYACANALGSFYLPVLASGLCVLAFEQFANGRFAARSLADEREELHRIR